MTDEANIIAADLNSQNQFYTTASDWSIPLLTGFEKGKTPGETSYIKKLDDMFTLRPGFLYCFTGWPASGKSEFITQLSVLQGYFKKRKAAIYAPESYPVDEYIDMVVHCYLGRTTDRRFPHVCSLEQYKEAIQWANDLFYFCDWPDTPNAETLLSAFEWLHKHKGCEIFIVDPFNGIITEGEERNIAIALKKNLTAFKRFAQQKRVMVWLVEHPKTPTDTKEFDTIPGPRNLFGGTMWWNKVDVLATVHRMNREDRNDTEIIFKTWKIKKQELNGHPGQQSLYFSMRSKRYYEDLGFTIHPMQPSQMIEDMYKQKDRPF